MSRWHETDYGAERLHLERLLLAEDYPQMNMIICDDGKVRVEGYLGSNNVCAGSYYVVAEYPDSYPYNRIMVWCPYVHFPPGTPHLYSDDELCIEHGDFGPDDTISTVLGWATEWLAMYENYLRTRERW